MKRIDGTKTSGLALGPSRLLPSKNYPGVVVGPSTKLFGKKLPRSSLGLL